MALIKNLHLLKGMAAKDLEMMEHAARQHKQFGSITFKIIAITTDKIIFQIAQGKSGFKNYQQKKRLIEIVHETFGRFFKGIQILVQPIPYNEAPVKIVTRQWIRKQMLLLGIKTKHIAADTDISVAELSDLINGTEPLSKSEKAMFYYYFFAKKKISDN